MPRYRLKAPFFAGSTLHKAGESIDFDGEPGRNMYPLDDEARERVREKYGDDAVTDATPQKFNVGGAGTLWPIPRR